MPTNSVPVSIAVLGVDHFKRIEPPPTGDEVSELVETLAAFEPDAVAIERLSGVSIVSMLGDRQRYDEALDSFASDMLAAAAVANEGDHEVVKRVAAYDLNNALLIWSSMEDGAKAALGLPRELVQVLDGGLASRREDVVLGIPLAKRCGVDELWPIDDFTDEYRIEPVGEELMAGYRAFGVDRWAEQLHAGMNELKASRRSLVEYLAHINEPEMLADDVRIEWEILLDEGFPQPTGRVRLGVWQLRNLAMATNIYRRIVESGKRRVLVIVGASHRPFLEKYLAQMIDVEIENVCDLLAAH
ncbi:MAG: DUF5694 domain-containing protein [Fimbriimonas sp.]|nr:DUF5694 domain-containing protein [Fimbriimonas sp.]